MTTRMTVTRLVTRWKSRSDRADHVRQRLLAYDGEPAGTWDVVPRQRSGAEAAEGGRATWAILCPPNASVVDSRDGWRQVAAQPPGSAVVMVDDRPASRWRLRTQARLAGVRIERELILLPTRRHPWVVLDDDARSVRLFWSSIATVPHRGRAALPASALLRLARRLPWQCTGLAPGRVVVGTRR